MTRANVSLSESIDCETREILIDEKPILAELVIFDVNMRKRLVSKKRIPFSKSAPNSCVMRFRQILSCSLGWTCVLVAILTIPGALVAADEKGSLTENWDTQFGKSQEKQIRSMIGAMPFSLGSKIVMYNGKGEAAKECEAMFFPGKQMVQISFQSTARQDSQISYLFVNGTLFQLESSDSSWTPAVGENSYVFFLINEALKYSTKTNFLFTLDELKLKANVVNNVKRNSSASIGIYLELLARIQDAKDLKDGKFEWHFPLRTLKGELSKDEYFQSVDVFDRRDKLLYSIRLERIADMDVPEVTTLSQVMSAETEIAKPKWGIQFEKLDNGPILVVGLLKGGAMENAGLKMGYKIEKINSTELSSLSWKDVFKLFSETSENEIVVSGVDLDNKKFSKKVRLSEKSGISVLE